MFERRYFILAPNFHGATLLGRLLNAHPEVMGLGDTYPSQRFDQICGCGAKVSQCEFWSAVRADIAPERYARQPHWLPGYPEIFGGRPDRLLFNTLQPSALEHLIPDAARETFANDFESFLASIHRHGQRPDVRVYVDGAKSVARIFALLASGVQIDGVIHLHRSPGDYIKSTMKQAGSKPSQFLYSLAGYRMFHGRARRTGQYVPYLSLTYEGLAEETERTVSRILQFMGVSPAPLPSSLAAEKGRPWHFMGSASLFDFDGTIRPSRYRLSRCEAFLTHVVAGQYRPNLLHLSGRGS